LDDSVDEETDCPEFPNDARNYSGIFGQWPKMSFGPTLAFIINAGRVVFIYDVPFLIGLKDK
jgi:hypothetical protein